MRRAAFALAAVFSLASGCGNFEGALSFLREAPDTKLIPGVYELDPAMYSGAALKKRGYDDLSATVELRPDLSFTVKRMPDCCVYGQDGSFGGYFDGAGVWSVEKSESVYQVRLDFKTLKRTGRTNAELPRHYDKMEFVLTKDPVKYGLAAGLFDGEYWFAYFRKKGLPASK